MPCLCQKGDNWSYNWGSEWGICTVNIMYIEITLRLGYKQSFLLEDERVTTDASYREEAGFALASWVEKVTLSAGMLPPTTSQLLEDGAPHPEALCRGGAGAGARQVRAACPRECRF